jgi:hypothetical protein
VSQRCCGGAGLTQELCKTAACAEWRNGADGTDVQLAKKQEGHGTVTFDGVVAFDPVKVHILNALVLAELYFELDPRLLTASLVAVGMASSSAPPLRLT